MRYLGLDVGRATIGVAVSDLLGLTAQGVETVRRKSLESDLKRLKQIADMYETCAFVVGLPKNMNGTEGESATFAREFAGEIIKEIPTAKISFWDERLTTVLAHKTLIEADMSRKKRKKVVDKMAAVFILQGFLDRISMQKG